MNVIFIKKILIIFICKFCNEKFVSNNKLYWHVKQIRHQFEFVINFIIVFQNNIVKNQLIIKFIAFTNVDFDYNYHLWNYVQISICHKLNDEVYKKYVNIDTSMFLINRQFLNILSHDDIHRIFISMQVREINICEHDSFE